ncbi:hypothetical protein ACLOJK_027734 [Asimina triloba]
MATDLKTKPSLTDTIYFPAMGFNATAIGGHSNSEKSTNKATSASDHDGDPAAGSLNGIFFDGPANGSSQRTPTTREMIPTAATGTQRRLNRTANSPSSLLSDQKFFPQITAADPATRRRDPIQQIRQRVPQTIPYTIPSVHQSSQTSKQCSLSEGPSTTLRPPSTGPTSTPACGRTSPAAAIHPESSESKAIISPALSLDRP